MCLGSPSFVAKTRKNLCSKPRNFLPKKLPNKVFRAKNKKTLQKKSKRLLSKKTFPKQGKFLPQFPKEKFCQMQTTIPPSCQNPEKIFYQNKKNLPKTKNLLRKQPRINCKKQEIFCRKNYLAKKIPFVALANCRRGFFHGTVCRFGRFLQKKNSVFFRVLFCTFLFCLSFFACFLLYSFLLYLRAFFCTIFFCVVAFSTRNFCRCGQKVFGVFVETTSRGVVKRFLQQLAKNFSKRLFSTLANYICKVFFKSSTAIPQQR